jgi:hypothetical protein
MCRDSDTMWCSWWSNIHRRHSILGMGEDAGADGFGNSRGKTFVDAGDKERLADIYRLTNDATDPISKIMEAKVCAVRIDKLQQ